MSLSVEEFHQEDEREALRKANSDLQRRLKQAKAKSADLVEAVHLAAREAAIIVGRPQVSRQPKADRRTKKAEMALLLCSDWHWGKQTSSYNSQVAAERVQRLGDKVLRITEIERADHPVRECHALLAGDMADGTGIFPGQEFEVDSTTFQQLFAAAAGLEGLLARLLSSFPTLHVWEQIGNHGRIGRRGDYPRFDNIDLLVYRLARERLSDYERSARLVWHPATSWHSIVEAGSYRVLLIHGDQIRSFGGNVPAFGIARKTNAWASGVLGDFTDVMLGHFHQPLVIPLANGVGRAFVNPSIESDSEYAKEFVAATGTPAQRLFFVDPDRGRITSERLIWVD